MYLVTKLDKLGKQTSRTLLASGRAKLCVGRTIGASSAGLGFQQLQEMNGCNVALKQSVHPETESTYLDPALCLDKVKLNTCL